MKKLLLAAVAVIAVGSASSSFAGGCGTSYVTVQQPHYTPQTTYVVQQQSHYQQVVTVPVYRPVHVEKKVIVQQPVVTTTYTKPCVQTYQTHTPVYYNHTPVYSGPYTTSCGY
ncbi:MAG: hypothetical protein P1U89_26095 [Verrucomicrobiales bacterium]|nr:hypothetical protein [Verrucomicrobiales bacterium]